MMEIKNVVWLLRHHRVIYIFHGRRGIDHIIMWILFSSCPLKMMNDEEAAPASIHILMFGPVALP